jgi:hypothetical protein
MSSSSKSPKVCPRRLAIARSTVPAALRAGRRMETAGVWVRRRGLLRWVPFLYRCAGGSAIGFLHCDVD